MPSTPAVKENRSPHLGFVAEMPEPDSTEDERILWGSPRADPETRLPREIDHATVGLVLRQPIGTPPRCGSNP
jgi:hypothetical protein